MGEREGLPGRWLDLRLGPAAGAAGLGPALGWLAGVLAAGAPFWTWPALGWFLLGLFLTTAVWGRLWALLGEEGTPSPPPHAPVEPGEVPLKPPETDSNEPSHPQRHLPYTVPGSLSHAWGTALHRAWQRLRGDLRARRRWWIEISCLAGLLLVMAGLWGRGTLLAAPAGLALLGLRRLTWGRATAQFVLQVFGGMAWPWWLGHLAWSPLSAPSLLLSLLWGLAYAGWAGLDGYDAGGLWRAHGAALRPSSASRRWPLLWTDLAQGGVMAFFLLSGRPIIGAALAFALLGQGLLQAGLTRAGRWAEIAGRTWPFAAAGMVLAGATLGGWI